MVSISQASACSICCLLEEQITRIPFCLFQKAKDGIMHFLHFLVSSLESLSFVSMTKSIVGLSPFLCLLLCFTTSVSLSHHPNKPLCLSRFLAQASNHSAAFICSFRLSLFLLPLFPCSKNQHLPPNCPNIDEPSFRVR